MSDSPRMLIGPRIQLVILGLLAAGLAVGGFHVGRQSVDAAALSKHTAETRVESPNLFQRDGVLAENPLGQGSVREIATVPFSELYDVLKSASREQLLAWARDLEQMPRGPRQRAAVNAYYKSLIQVDHRVAIEALFQSENLNMRDLAIDAMTKASPESIWADLAEMTTQITYPGRLFSGYVIKNWSRVDPVAASEFIEMHPLNAEQMRPDGEDVRVVSLLGNWGEIDPSAARNWLEADASRQTKDALRAFVTSWGRVDHAGAIDYAVANASRPDFESAINDLVYDFVRSAKEDASSLVLLLPPERAKAALKNVADITNPEVVSFNPDRPPDYERPPDEVARWMVNLPVEVWNESIGQVAQAWLREDALAATNWFDQLHPDVREVVIVSLCGTRQSAPREHVVKLAWTIRDHGMREKALRTVAGSLRIYRANREEAIEAVNDLPISDEQKAYLRKIMPEDENGH
jgi:hypothetical protein